MPAFTPKACFAVDDLTCWCDPQGPISRTAGPAPDVVEVHMIKAQFDLLQGDYVRRGKLKLFFSDPNTPDVTLDFWIDHVEDVTYGVDVANPGAGAAVQKKAVFLVDRRWEFLDAGGGVFFGGMWNKTSSDGGAFVSVKTGKVLTLLDCYHYYRLAQFLVTGMYYKTAGTDLEKAIDYSALEKAPYTSSYPPNVDTDGVDRFRTLMHHMEEMAVALVLRNDNTYALIPIGDGADPVLPVVNEYPSEAFRVTRSGVNAAIVFCSAPARRLLMTELTGIRAEDDSGTGDWTFVGPESDGTLKKLDDVSYVNATGLTAINAFHRRFADLTILNHWLADTTFYRWVKIHPSQVGCLPFLSQGVQRMTDAGSVIRSDSPVRAWARTWYIGSDGLGYNTNGLVEILNFECDPVAGVLKFPTSVGTLRQDGIAIDDTYGVFVPATDDFKVIVTHEAQENDTDTPWLSYYCVGFQRDANGTAVKVTEGVLADWMTAGQMPIVSDTRLVEMFDTTGTSLNGDKLDALCLARAQRAFDIGGQDGRVRRFFGIHNISCGAKVCAVRWSLAEGITEVEYKTFAVPKCDLLERMKKHKHRGQAAAASTKSEIAPQMAKAGTRDYASQPVSSRGGSGMTSQGLAISYAKASAGWTQDSGNTMQMAPCSASGAVLLDDQGAALATVPIAFINPVGAGRPLSADIATGDVVAYLRMGNSGGLAIAVNGFPAFLNNANKHKYQGLYLSDDVGGGSDFTKWTLDYLRLPGDVT